MNILTIAREMRTAHKIFALVALFALLASSVQFVNVAQAVETSPYGSDDITTVQLCHWDESGGGSYKSAGNVNINSVVNGGGHAGHGDDSSEDIIPPFFYDGGKYYPGKFWNEANEDIWNTNGTWKPGDEPGGECGGDGILGNPEIDLEVTKVADDTTPAEGDTVVYTITVTNNGPDDATGVTVTDTVPAGTTFVSADPTEDDNTAGTLTWDVGNLANGASWDVDVTVTVDADTEGDVITNTAAATGNENDSDDTNDSADEDITVEILGCTDENADNYDQSATQDDGSCTYPETTGTLVVKKTVEGGQLTEDAFSFTINGAATTTFESDGENVLSGQTTGTYTIVEVPVANYETSYNNCTEVEVTAGATTTCEITNTYREPTATGTIVIVKEVVSEVSDWAFDFTGDLGNFQLTDATTSITFEDLNATATYNVSEVVPQDWSDPVLSCDDSNSVEGQNPEDAVISLEPNETVTCTFTNRKPQGPTFLVDGYKWHDENGNGLWDEGEDTLSGWTIEITDGTTTHSTTTDADGRYWFWVEEGNWTVSEVFQSGWNQTGTLENNEPVDGDVCEFDIFEPELQLQVLVDDVAENAYICDFGNQEEEDDGGGGSSTGGGGERIELRDDPGDEPEDEPEPEVLGEQVSAVPAGAPATGAGGAATTPLASLLAMFGMLFSLGALRVTRNG